MKKKFRMSFGATVDTLVFFSMADQPRPGELWKHVRTQGNYRIASVDGLSVLTDPPEPVVEYIAESNGQKWFRPLQNWMYCAIVGDEKQPRFIKIEDAPKADLNSHKRFEVNRYALQIFGLGQVISKNISQTPFTEFWNRFIIFRTEMRPQLCRLLPLEIYSRDDAAQVEMAANQIAQVAFQATELGVAVKAFFDAEILAMHKYVEFIKAKKRY